MSEPIAISVFSDVICPWCYVGKRRLERGLAEAPPAGGTEVEWLPFELNPDMPAEGVARADYRMRKFGAAKSAELDERMTALGREEGIAFAFDRMERTPNTRKAHRLIAGAQRSDHGDAVVEALFRAYFEDARDIGRDEVLAEIAAEAGMERPAALAALASEEVAREVEGRLRQGAEIGISGVPFFVVDKRWAVSGAQPSDAWAEVLGKVARGEPATEA